MSRLFEPLPLGELTLENRIVIAPMCQYSAEDGTPTDWHLMHLGALSQSGAGLLIVEATGVSPEARISYADTGLWSDENEAGFARVLASLRLHSRIPIAIQLGHAGRKASTHRPWDGGKQIAPGDAKGWQTVAPSAVPHNEADNAPLALDEAGLEKIRQDFAAAARRADRLGLAGIEVHGAHGYLLHQFLSPLANKRTDRYGGSLENRMRFPIEVFEVVRAAFPADKPVWIRLSASDWVDGGWDVDGTIALSRELEKRGCAAIHVSSGGVSTGQQIPLGPGYQVDFARAVKAAVSIPVIAVGLITEPDQAEGILANDQADAVALARGMLYDPRWPWHAAAALGASVEAPPQFHRSQPHGLTNLFRT